MHVHTHRHTCTQTQADTVIPLTSHTAGTSRPSDEHSLTGTTAPLPPPWADLHINMRAHVHTHTQHQDKGIAGIRAGWGRHRNVGKDMAVTKRWLQQVAVTFAVRQISVISYCGKRVGRKHSEGNSLWVGQLPITLGMGGSPFTQIARNR